jgi:phosphatidylglycerophosphatase A
LKLNFFEKLLGSGLFTGYIPFASGTFGSLIALTLYLIPGFENPTILLIFIALSSSAGIFLGNKFEIIYGKDPSEFTLDEMVGMWIALLFVPKTVVYITISFLLWRVLDIIKPFPARLSEKLKGGVGIVIDDIISGIYTLIIMQILINFTF